MTRNTLPNAHNLLLGMCLGVMTFWLFALAMTPLAPVISAKLDLPPGAISLPVGFAGLVAGILIVSSGLFCGFCVIAAGVFVGRAPTRRADCRFEPFKKQKLQRGGDGQFFAEYRAGRHIYFVDHVTQAQLTRFISR